MPPQGATQWLAQDVTAVDADNFWGHLPEVLEDIAAAEYIGLDLEMSGIRLRDGISGRLEKLTVEEYYAAGVEAAKAFQILEVGITCFRYQPKNRSYHWKTYSFQLAPWYLGHDQTNAALAKFLDRRFSLSGNTVEFLRASRSDDLPLRVMQKGIMYLSRKETRDAYDQFVDPRTRERAPVVIEDEPLAVQDFCAGVRDQLTKWLDTVERNDQAYLNIENPYGDRLTSLQIRLIHQLIEAEFKEHGLRGNVQRSAGFMQITMKGTDAGQDKIIDRQICDRQLAIRQQKGFRFVFEALVGGDFAEEIDVELLLGPGTHSQAAVDEMRGRLLKIESAAKARGKVLIAHNPLYDICFLYQSFIGDLPPTLKQFKIDLQVLFPRLVDTKYMARRGMHELDADLSLRQLYATVNRQQLPLIFPSRPPAELAHHAGYDSEQ